MKVGDLIRLRLPYMDKNETAVLLKSTNLSQNQGTFSGDPTDVWWEVLLNGELTQIHQDYVREIINESR